MLFQKTFSFVHVLLFLGYNVKRVYLVVYLAQIHNLREKILVARTITLTL